MHVEAINIGPSDAIALTGSVSARAGRGLEGDCHFFARGALPGQGTNPDRGRGSDPVTVADDPVTALR